MDLSSKSSESFAKRTDFMENAHFDWRKNEIASHGLGGNAWPGYWGFGLGPAGGISIG
jgi:hypothetical protein